jgi:hypothetical protein
MNVFDVTRDVSYEFLGSVLGAQAKLLAVNYVNTREHWTVLTGCAYSIGMDAPSQEELDVLRAAAHASGADSVVHWHSAFGLTMIETRGGQVFVNADPVRPANLGPAKDSA